MDGSDYQKNINLDSITVKNKILHNLYRNKIKMHDKIQTIIDTESLDQIKNNDYIICPRFAGTRSWIMFLKIDDVHYAVNFPKQNYRKQSELKIHPIDIGVISDFYNGTIMEGIYYKIMDERFLIIDEIYVLSGKNQLIKAKDDRLDDVSKYITENTKQNPKFHMYVCKYYRIIEKNLKELYDKIKGDNKIQDIIFYPKIYGRKIYQYTIIDIDLIDDVIKLGTFKLQKTNVPDVYNIVSLKTEKKIDIAYIPDIETSKKCKEWFKSVKTNKKTKLKELTVRCKKIYETGKWLPLEIVETVVEDPDSTGHDSGEDHNMNNDDKDTTDDDE